MTDWKFPWLSSKQSLFIEAAQKKLIVTTPEPERLAVAELVSKTNYFVRWAKRAELLWDGCIRARFHSYPEALRSAAKQAGFRLDARSNGPAIAAFLLAGGERPVRDDNGQGWSIHHLYDGKFPFETKDETLHAVKDGTQFTQSAGLIAVHPLFDRAIEIYPEIALTMRLEAMQRFSYDPDGAFGGGPINRYGFTKGVVPLVRYSKAITLPMPSN